MNLSDTTKIICPGASALLVYTTKKKNRKKRTLLKTPAMKTKESNMVKKNFKGPRQDSGSFEKFVRVKIFCPRGNKTSALIKVMS